MDTGYALFPDDTLPSVNDFKLSFSLGVSQVPTTTTDAVTSDLLVLARSVVETATEGVLFGELVAEPAPAGPLAQAEPSGPERCGEVDFEVPLMGAGEYELITFEALPEEVGRIVRAGENAYEMTSGEKKVRLVRASVDGSRYVVLASGQKAYSVSGACSVRKVKEARPSSL
ncbi:hypothetical protein NEDG_00050 [Nematocida displodere]|uniref:Uncharacterized protein n=1 Tax=Nematocida displodere TaxID=1805483 RepID=A0A177EHX6_9MICR|nr:hypothetical protein NEDG_00050 [Nematocida displodere]